jgi:hypothetical protein
MHIFRRIFLSNYWWQESDIIKLVTKCQISAINSCWEKCDEKCAYMFNVYKNQQSRYTGSRNLTGPKTLPTIWHTYMKLVTKYQIPVINSCWEKCDLTFMHIEHICSFFVAFFSATIDDRNLIFGHKLHIGTPYRGKPFLTCQIPTSCLPTYFTSSLCSQKYFTSTLYVHKIILLLHVHYVFTKNILLPHCVHNNILLPLYVFTTIFYFHTMWFNKI